MADVQAEFPVKLFHIWNGDHRFATASGDEYILRDDIVNFCQENNVLFNSPFRNMCGLHFSNEDTWLMFKLKFL